jgi:UDP-N-acetylglucosamine--N-acetylmuramyl-(pentapeptide) pyrophosphoryl-undecaprenol N-acetylglucosamine transferase
MVLPRTALAVARILHEFRPKVVLGVGGYLAGPVMLEAALSGIPTVLIEPNAQPGVTNRLLAPVVTAAAVGFAETASVYGRRAHVTGIPVRREFFAVPPAAPSEHFTLLVLGGSQGSHAINQAVVAAVPLLFQASQSVRIIHQTGEHDYNDVLNSYQECRLLSEVYPFIDDMPGALARADLVISRAGALTVSELAAAGRPAVFIPFPGAGQHQLDNARTMGKAGAARVIAQLDLTATRLAEEVRQLMAQPGVLATMGASARRLARPDAAAAIADLVEKLALRYF